MLNFSSNNPGGKLDGLKAKLGAQQGPVNAPEDDELIIEEVYDEEPDDYNYKPQLREVSEEELRNLSAIRDTGTDYRVLIASIGFLVAALVGAGVGYILASNAADKADVTRKSAVASVINNSIDAKLTGISNFEKDFKIIAENDFDEEQFDSVVPNYNRYGFMLDISSDISPEAVLLAGNGGENPLKSLREYSRKTMLLMQLLSTHVNETHSEAEAIVELQKDGKQDVMLAMQVMPEAVYYLSSSAPRRQYANNVLAMYTYKEHLTDDKLASEAYSQLKIDYKWSNTQRERRDYVPADNKEKKALEEQELDLPNHLIYRVLDRSGKELPLFADEVVLVDRKLLFGDSATALDRYKQRNAQIQRVMAEAVAASATIKSELEKFIVE